MFRMSAPYPQSTVTILLPNPEYNDPIAAQSQIVKHTMTGGTIRTFVVRIERFKISIMLSDLSPAKTIELERFLSAYQDNEILLDMPWRLRRRWRAYLQTNPFSSTHGKKSTKSISLEFEGVYLP